MDIKASRISDRLPLSIRLVPVDEGYEELDIIEHLSSSSIRSNATALGVIAMVPLVGFVPLSENWTAVVSESWDDVALNKLNPSDFPVFVKDVVGVSIDSPPQIGEFTKHLTTPLRSLFLSSPSASGDCVPPLAAHRTPFALP